MPDGGIDLPDAALAAQDFVIAGVHSHFKMTRAEMTERIVKAMRNPNVDIISHPTGRILKRRDEYEIDFDAILRVAKAGKKILEINAVPDRLDLNDVNIMKCVKAGVKMIVNTDAHQTDQLADLRFGAAQARRGWAQAEDIVNTLSARDLLRLLKTA